MGKPDRLLAFQRLGHQVSAFDASAPLAEHASRLLGQTVPVRRFAEVDEVERYDGIWACASLLHVPASQLPDAFARLWRALKPGGVLYCSFKLGSGERLHHERHFTDADEARLAAWTQQLPGLTRTHCWTSTDQRPGRSEQWLNALLHKASSKLVTGGDEHPFLPHLCAAIHQAHRVDMAVAFIKTTGLRLLLPDLLESLQRSESQLPPAQVRILTSDYLDVTDPEALRLLMLLAEQGAQVRVYQSSGSSFHLKAYLFSGQDWGRAFIGSSNISRLALQQGLEWNYRIDYPGDDGYLEARRRFDELFAHPRSTLLSDAWIDAYEQRRIQPTQSFEPGSTESEPPPTPSKVQREALQALSATRAEGYLRGLVVLATGLGKTWLAAFDVKQMGARRVLFVAHREEILNQAAATFARIQPTASIGFYRGQQRDNQVDILCASVQTLGKAEHLQRFKAQHFDYLVVDEFHHASAPTYRRLLQHFAPAFLLGLTATPDRTDNADILALCDDNLVYASDLFCGVTEKLLVPFHYYGVFDSDVDYQAIPWRNGRFDPELLGNKLATLGRARHALSTWRLHAQQRTLAFCVSTRHADFMADYFRKQGVRAAAVYADSQLSRGEALEQLSAGQLQVLFSVDLFNEGVDLPSIDTVMMLRPTESKILFLQQLGRGLRKADGKDKLVVLDFVANHQSFLHKPMALMNRSMNHRQLAEFGRKAERGQLELPEGCFVNYDLQFIDFLKSLDSAGKITGETVAIERQDESGDNQYLLRKVLKDANGQYRLRANNPDYADILVSDELREQLRTFARLKAVIDPLQMQVGQRFMREEIPPLFGVEFNAGNWNSGHVVIGERNAHVLLVTLNKQGKAEDLRYRDHWIDEQHFHWQTQNQTAPDNKRGKEIIHHAALGIDLHLFVRDNKLENGKAAPFRYYGKVNYQSHSGSKPMSVVFELDALTVA